MPKFSLQLTTALCFSCIIAILAGDFMHGAKDTGATALNLAELAGADQASLIQSEGLPDDAKGTGLIVLSNQSITFKNPVIANEKIGDFSGKILRFYVWIKADGLVAKNLWFDAPTITLDLYDDYGATLVHTSSLFKTRGTYPWHCYYVDVKLPQHITISGKAANALSDDLQALLDAAGDTFGDGDVTLTQPGLYLTLSAMGEGTATFGGISYEVITAKQFADHSKWLDSASGTCAPNPEYDELPVILYFGVAADQPWKFLEGNQAFGSLLTIDGLRDYVEANCNDWFHLQKGIAMLPYLYTTASLLELTPAFEDGWLDALRNELLARQDFATGFWTVNGIPNLLATEAIASNCFMPNTLKRADISSAQTPWTAAGDSAVLQHPAEIIKTLLANRVEGLPAWNDFFMQPPEFGGLSRDTAASLSATTAAVKLLAQAASLLPAADPQREEAKEAIKQAYTYAMGTFLLPSRPGLWREDSISAAPSDSGAFFLDLLNATSALEHRVNPALPAPTIEILSEDERGIRVVWKDVPKNLNSVRIYAAPANVKPQFLTEKNICCFIEREDASLRTEDPLVATRKIADAARTEWNLTPEAIGCDYLGAKVTALPKRLPLGKAEKPVNVEPPAVTLYTVADNADEEDTSIVFYAVGVNVYGECTNYLPIKGEEPGVDF